MSSTALSEFEWDEGMTMPVANAENKALEDEVNKFWCMYRIQICGHMRYLFLFNV